MKQWFITFSAFLIVAVLFFVIQRQGEIWQNRADAYTVRLNRLVADTEDKINDPNGDTYDNAQSAHFAWRAAESTVRDAAEHLGSFALYVDKEPLRAALRNSAGEKEKLNEFFQAAIKAKFAPLKSRP